MSRAFVGCHRWLGAGWGVLAVFFVHAAAAADRVVIVEGNDGDPVVERIVQELRSVGFVVRVAPDDGPPGAKAPVADGTDAVLRVTRSSTTELWVVDPTTHGAAEVETIPVAPPRASSASGLALRLAEELRAWFLPVPPHAESPSRVAQPPNTDAAPPSPGESPLPAPSTMSAVDHVSATEANVSSSVHLAKFGVDAGGLLLVNTEGVPPAMESLVSGRWMPWSALAVRALAALPVASPSVSAAEGSARVTTWMAGGDVEWRLTRETSPWSATVGAGAAAALVGTQGTANAPLVSSSGQAVCAVPFLTVRGARDLWPGLRLGIEGMVGAATREVAIQFASQPVAKWGGALAGAALALQLDGPFLRSADRESGVESEER